MISSSKTIFYSELRNIKQVLINNHFPNFLVDKEIKLFINNLSHAAGRERDNNPSPINIFYCNQLHKNYHIDERVLKDIIRRYVSPSSGRGLKFIIYYKKRKTTNLVINNNISQADKVLEKNNVIYQFNCPIGECNCSSYIGHTTNTLSRRLTLHLSDTSSIAQHLKKHGCQHSQFRNIMVENTKILQTDSNVRRLKVLEALYIKVRQPKINNINYESSKNILKCLC